LTSCAAPPKAIECAPVEVRVEKVVEDRIVAVPEWATKPIEKPYVAEESKDIIGLSSGYKARGVRIDQCNGRLDSIRSLVPQEDEEL